MEQCQQCLVRYMKGQSGTSTAVTNEKNGTESSVPEQRSQLGLGALGRGSGSCRKNRSTDADITWPRSALHDSHSSQGKIRTAVKKPTIINTTLDVTSNAGHGTTSKISNASAPPNTCGTEIMALPQQKGYSRCSRIFGPKIFIYNLLMEGKCINAM
eukprot:11658848-Ditylum_brightwellii.AAC.1